MGKAGSIKLNIHHLVACLAGMALCFSSAIHADVYKSVDKYGRITYSDNPVNINHVRLVKTWKGWVPQPSSKLNSANFAKNKMKYTQTVDFAAALYKLPKSLLHAVITTESAYDPSAVSTAGAVGLMQLMPATAKRYGVKNRKDPYENIQGGSHYLRDLMNMFNNDMKLAVAAYNAGENAVIRYGKRVPPFPETQNYVNKVLFYYKQYNKTYGS